MPEFQYQGIDRGGKKVTGKIDAPNEGELRIALRGQGIRPVRISKVGVFSADLGNLLSGGAGTVSLPILITFTRQLQVLIASGVPLVQSLDLLAEQSDHAGLKTVVSAVKEKVSSGTFLWESLAAYPLIFPKIYVALIRAGESSGALDSMLKRLTRYLEDADRLKKILKSAMIYPAVVILIGVAVVAVMLIFVIPKFEELLVSGGQTLPLPTQIVIDLSHFLVNNILFIIAALAGTTYLVARYIRSDEGRAFLHRLVYGLPLFGDLSKKAGVARFSRTMSTLLSSGVNLIDAVDICKSTIDNVVLEEGVSKIRSEVEAGKTIGMVVGKIPFFPKMAVQMIVVGENTGNLDKMLDKVADFYETEVETSVGGLTKLIEPLVLVFLGGAVGGLMLAMYLPIFKIAGGAQ